MRVTNFDGAKNERPLSSCLKEFLHPETEINLYGSPISQPMYTS